MTRPPRSAAVVILLTGLLAVARAEVIEQVLIKVNGEIVTKTELEDRQVTALRQMGQPADLKNNPSDAQLRKMLDDVTPDLVVTIVDEMLVLQRGKELGYKMSEEQFQSYLDNIKKDSKIETEEQFQAALKQENMTMTELRKNVEKTVIMSRVQQNEVVGRLAVSEADARRFYEAHKSEFTTPQSITLREILVTVPGSATVPGAGTVAGAAKTFNVGLDEEARQKAADIRQRAIGGESFEKLATDLSDAPSRANAGLIGPLNLSDLSPDLQKLIGGMKAGEVSQVLRSPTGYQILKLEVSSASETLPFEQARDQISERVFAEKRKDEFDKYLKKLRTQAIIEFRNDDIKKAYDVGLERMKTGVSASQ
jgi:peptidyl-prolyl cis-trans isomerase SurA